MGRTKESWSKASHERHAARLVEKIKKPKTKSSYERKKLIEAAITDDFPRY